MSKSIPYVNDSVSKVAIRKWPWIAPRCEEVSGFVKKGDTIVVEDAEDVDMAVVYDWTGKEFVRVTSPHVGYINRNALEEIRQNG